MSDDLATKLAEQEWEQWLESRPAPESLLIRHIKAHIHKGEAAKERATKNQKKSDDHFIAAGLQLTLLKTHYAPSWQAWETILKAKVGFPLAAPPS